MHAELDRRQRLGVQAWIQDSFLNCFINSPSAAILKLEAGYFVL